MGLVGLYIIARSKLDVEICVEGQRNFKALLCLLESEGVVRIGMRL